MAGTFVSPADGFGQIKAVMMFDLLRHAFRQDTLTQSGSLRCCLRAAWLCDGFRAGSGGESAGR
jgi:hypothetical protein